MMASRQLLFIYGTLRRGGRAHDRMADAEYLGTGSIKGRLVHIDHYPGLILDSENFVKGELYRVNEAQMKELDQYEGCNESPPHYTAERVEVRLDNGEVCHALTYVFRRLEPDQEMIEYGDWIEWYKKEKA